MSRYLPTLALIVPLIIPAMPAPAHAQQPALVQVDPVVEQEYTHHLPVLGRLTARRSGQVAARTGGAVSRVLVDVGDRVRAGQVLVRIDDAPLQLRVQQARAQLSEARNRHATARAQLALASQEVKRLEQLQGSAAASQAAYDDAIQGRNIALSRADEAEAAVNSSRSALGLAELQLGYARIAAPFDGAVTEKLTEMGNYLQPGQAVLRLVSDLDLELEADVEASLLPGVPPGTEVAVALENGSRHLATVRAIIPEENPRTRTRRVRFSTDFGADSGALASEQGATVFLPASAPKTILSVHKDGISRRGADDVVYVVLDGVAQPRKILTGDPVGERVEVISGLEAGDVVVVRGNERLAPGQPVQVSEAQ